MINTIINYWWLGFSLFRGLCWKLCLKLRASESHLKGYVRVASGSSYKLLGNNIKIRIKGSVHLRHNCSIVIENGLLEIGAHFFMNNGSSINVHNHVSIGDNCILGEGVKIYDHNHVFNKTGLPFHQQGFSTGKIEIGNNVWLGSNTVILKGASIGDNVVIGANCVIKGHIPSNSIVTAERELNIQNINYIN